MPVHIHSGNDLHDLNRHEITTKSWTGSTDIIIYSSVSYSGAAIVAQITNGTNVCRYIIEVGHSGTNTGLDVTEIALTGTYLDMTFTGAMASDNYVLTIANSVGTDNNTIKYYIIPSDL